MGNSSVKWKSGHIVLLVIIGAGLAFIITFIARDKSPSFRKWMDRVIPINPFNMANIVLKADQEKYVKDLHFQYQNNFRAFIQECTRAGWNIICTSGYRSFAKQRELNRQNPANAKPGRSHHNYGLALDINATRGGTWLKKASSESAWVNSGIPAIAKKHGISWQYKFGTYKDPVHFFIKKDITQLYNAALAAAGGNELKIVGNKVAIA